MVRCRSAHSGSAHARTVCGASELPCGIPWLRDAAMAMMPPQGLPYRHRSQMPTVRTAGSDVHRAEAGPSGVRSQAACGRGWATVWATTTELRRFRPVLAVGWLASTICRQSSWSSRSGSPVRVVLPIPPGLMPHGK